MLQHRWSLQAHPCRLGAGLRSGGVLKPPSGTAAERKVIENECNGKVAVMSLLQE